MNDSPQLIILGASTRAAAQSAAASGIRTWAADLFADADAAPLGEVVRVDDYPDELFRVAEQAPQAPWMYTGALENYPRRVETLSGIRPLAGNGAAVLAIVRHPDRWHALARDCGLATPVTRFTPPTAGDGWLRKLLRSTAGSGVRRVLAAADYRSSPGVYWQQLVAGRPGSTMFISDSEQATRVGSLWQLARGTAPVSEFQYTGSWGPAHLPDDVTMPLDRFATALTRTAGLRGIWGLDHVYDGRQLWALEINPRWTAGVELLERAGGLPLIAPHLAACESTQLPPLATKRRLSPLAAELASAWSAGLDAPKSGDFGDRRKSFSVGDRASRADVVGKRIVFARRSGQVSARLEQLLRDWSEQTAAAADIPRRGQPLSRGQPICTVFAGDVCEEGVLRELRQRESQVWDAAERLEAG